MGKRYTLSFSEVELNSFAIINQFGIPLGSMKYYLALPPEERKEMVQTGIPCDTAANELADWIVFSRVVNPRTRFAINADRNTPYHKVKALIDLFREHNISRFNLITTLETQHDESF